MLPCGVHIFTLICAHAHLTLLENGFGPDARNLHQESITLGFLVDATSPANGETKYFLGVEGAPHTTLQLVNCVVEPVPHEDLVLQTNSYVGGFWTALLIKKSRSFVEPHDAHTSLFHNPYSIGSSSQRNRLSIRKLLPLGRNTIIPADLMITAPPVEHILRAKSNAHRTASQLVPVPFLQDENLLRLESHKRRVTLLIDCEGIGAVVGSYGLLACFFPQILVVVVFGD